MEVNFQITAEGLQELKDKLDYKLHVERNEVIEDLKAARAQGDLSENADYDAARDHQAKLEAEIKELELRIKNAEVIEVKKGSKIVRLGSTVEIQELDTGDVLTYNIVGSVEADPLNGKLSNVTPLAMAIMDQKVGAVVHVNSEEPYDVKVLKIS